MPHGKVRKFTWLTISILIFARNRVADSDTRGFWKQWRKSHFSTWFTWRSRDKPYVDVRTEVHSVQHYADVFWCFRLDLFTCDSVSLGGRIWTSSSLSLSWSEVQCALSCVCNSCDRVLHLSHSSYHATCIYANVNAIPRQNWSNFQLWLLPHSNLRVSEQEERKTPKEKDTEGSSATPESETTETSQSEEASGETAERSQVCAQPDVAESFRARFSGPQFVVGDAYFVGVNTSTQSLFRRHAERVMKAFHKGFRSAALRGRYVQAFSSDKWEALSQSEKSCHSLSNCVACATQFEQLQSTFPLKPVFLCPGEDENESVSIERIDEICYQGTGKPFAELSANLGYNSASQVERIVKQTEKVAVRKTQQKCIAECKKLLEESAIQAVYTTDTSFSKYEKMRQAQYFNPPSEAHGLTKKWYLLWPDECDRHNELCQTLENWDPANKLVASGLAKEYNAKGSDSSHKIKLLALELNSSIPGSEIVPKPKSTRKKLGGNFTAYASSTKQETVS